MSARNHRQMRWRRKQPQKPAEIFIPAAPEAPQLAEAKTTGTSRVPTPSA